MRLREVPRSVQTEWRRKKGSMRTIQKACKMAIINPKYHVVWRKIAYYSALSYRHHGGPVLRVSTGPGALTGSGHLNRSMCSKADKIVGRGRRLLYNVTTPLPPPPPPPCRFQSMQFRMELGGWVGCVRIVALL